MAEQIYWEDHGLPPPDSTDYSYSLEFGTIRTPFETARPRQTRRHQRYSRILTASFKLSFELLKVAEQLLACYGYSWFKMNLVTGEGNLVPHCVRLVEPYTFSAVAGNYYSLSCVLEVRPQGYYFCEDD